MQKVSKIKLSKNGEEWERVEPALVGKPVSLGKDHYAYERCG